MSKISRRKANKAHKNAKIKRKPNFTKIRDDSKAVGGLRHKKHVQKGGS